MKSSIKKGIAFGLTSGTITTLGLMVGLFSGTHSRLVILGGVLTIAVADAFSDALGIHISEEAENQHSAKEIWESTFYTLLSKFLYALTFTIPIFFFELKTAVFISITYGLTVLTWLSFRISKKSEFKTTNVIFEHLLIAITVIIITYFVGDLIGKYCS